jgi:hypothetical protein
MEFATAKFEKLKELGVSEKCIINYLSSSLYPRNLETTALLRVYDNFEQFSRHLVEIENKMKRSREERRKNLHCTFCKGQGHDEGRCFKKHEKSA